MRCLALAEAWSSGTKTLWGDVDIDFVATAVRVAGVAQIDREPTMSQRSVLVVDTYDEAERHRGAGCSAAGARVLVDDVGCSVPEGYDAVWNPNAYGAPALYPGFGGAVFAGAMFTPVRQDIPRWTSGDAGSDVAITLGGSHIPEHIRAALEVLASDDAVRIRAAGSWVPPEWTHIDPTRLWADVIQAGCLLTAAGSTLWQAAVSRIPVVVLLMADNQRLIFEWAQRGGVPGVDALAIQDPKALARELRRALAEPRPTPPIPADGAARTAERLSSLISLGD
jgi:hypothetical protein